MILGFSSILVTLFFEVQLTSITPTKLKKV